jgi:hypothetical protein
LRKTLLRTVIAVGALALVLAGSAFAFRIEVGKLIVIGNGGFTPTKLPQDRNAPIRLHGYGKVETTDGSPPTPLKKLVFEFDKHGAVETRGLPVCRKAQLENTDTKRAREACGDAIVGKGSGTAVVNFPEQKPIIATSPLTIFNGPPKNGNPTIFVHAYLEVGGPSTFIVPVTIQKIHDGRYGFKTEAEIPKIVNGYGTPQRGQLSIGRTWQYKGKTLSYANARCADGRLQAKAQLTFKDGTFLQGTVLKHCQIRR